MLVDPGVELVELFLDGREPGLVASPEQDPIAGALKAHRRSGSHLADSANADGLNWVLSLGHLPGILPQSLLWPGLLTKFLLRVVGDAVSCVCARASIRVRYKARLRPNRSALLSSPALVSFFLLEEFVARVAGQSRCAQHPEDHIQVSTSDSHVGNYTPRREL